MGSGTNATFSLILLDLLYRVLPTLVGCFRAVTHLDLPFRKLVKKSLRISEKSQESLPTRNRNGQVNSGQVWEHLREHEQVWSGQVDAPSAWCRPLDLDKK